MKFLVTNELTLPRLLWRALLRRPTVAVEPRSILQGQQGFVGSIARSLGISRPIILSDDMPQLRRFADVGDLQRLTNVFAESEDWLEGVFDFAGSERRYGRYALAFRHIVCNEAFRRYGRGYLLDAALNLGSIHGYDDFDAQFLVFRFARQVRRKRVSVLLRSLANITLFCMISVATVAWVISRLRLSIPSPHRTFLASDYVGDPHDIVFWNEAATDRRDIAVVFRDAHYRQIGRDDVAGWPSYMPTDGVFSPGQAVAAIALALADGARLLFVSLTLPPDFYRSLAALPWKRLVYRALFNVVRPKYYLGRDDYNVDHIMRSQELRRIGGTSVSRMHGLPSIIPFTHQSRHLDFDIYYMHGTDQYEAYYKSRWPATMRVRSVGSFGLTREELAALREECPRDIAFILGPSFHEDAVIAAMEKLAYAFPDRTIWINTKITYRERGTFGPKFQRLTTDGPPNIREYRGKTYDLFFKAFYWFSESSTLIAEAVQFGRIGLCLDPDERFKFLYYRQYPALLIKNADEAVARIRDLEAGAAVFPRSDFAPMIDLSGNICWDEFRKDLGLAPLGLGPLTHLAFAGQASRTDELILADP